MFDGDRNKPSIVERVIVPLSPTTRFSTATGEPPPPVSSLKWMLLPVGMSNCFQSIVAPFAVTPTSSRVSPTDDTGVLIPVELTTSPGPGSRSAGCDVCAHAGAAASSKPPCKAVDRINRCRNRVERMICFPMFTIGDRQ
ncbi:hypothetical protein F4693_000651 [Sphingomonas endophytica]|uniref:Uncharacterized protein n=1 Tax=Sphingomonas endophytica TaxID=869719 RepID=A0A7X0JC37_9SPHN|nr:hypothetical protein [Sphingomonas endophytica]